MASKDLTLMIKARDEASKVLAGMGANVLEANKAMAALGAGIGATLGIMSDLAREGAADEASMMAVTTAAENAAAQFDATKKSLADNEAAFASNRQAIVDNVNRQGELGARLQTLQGLLNEESAAAGSNADRKRALQAEIAKTTKEMDGLDKSTLQLVKEQDALGPLIDKQTSQMAAMGVSTEEVNATLNDYLNHMRDTAAVADDAMKPALASLIATTGDYQKSMELASIAADLARGKNMDLKSAAELVGKVSEGNVSVLNRYGIVLGENATAEEALAALQQKFGGQAAAYAQTTQGQIEILNNRIGDFREELGSSLGQAQPWLAMLPGLSAGWTALSSAIAVVASGQAVATAQAIAHTAAQTAQSVATGAVTAAQWLLNAALTANPIGIVIVAIGALVAALVWLYNNNEDVRIAIDTAWAAIQTAIGTAVEAGSAAIDAFGKTMDNLGQTANQVWTGVTNTVRGAVNGIIGSINGMISAWNAIEFSLPRIEIPDWIPGIGGSVWGGNSIGTPDVPTIPYLARGGIISRPTLAVLGERGPEAVVPLGSGGYGSITVVVQGSVVSERELVDAIYDGLLRRKASNYSLGLS